MKKLLCSVLFAVGFFVAAHAQLSSTVVNNTGNNWDVTLNDSNGNNLPFTAPSGTNSFGPVGTSSSFPVTLSAVDQVTGCIVTGTITGTGNGTFNSSNCALPTIKYNAAVPSIGAIFVTLYINY